MQPARIFSLVAALVLGLAAAGAARAADRDELREFLKVTGFDVAITSMQQGAMAGPAVAGDAPEAFGMMWEQLAEQVFDPDMMLNRAMDMMAAIMPDDLVKHGVDFYGSDLGKRLVEAENAAHLTPDDEKYGEAEEIVSKLIDKDDPRIDLYRRMSDAIGGPDSAVRSAIELQVRYLIAAQAAGVIDMGLSEEDLRSMLETQSDALRDSVQMYSVLGSAYAYRDFSLDDVEAYTEALEDPQMRQVYEILNAIQFEIMAERYEVLASKLAGLAPQQDI